MENEADVLERMQKGSMKTIKCFYDAYIHELIEFAVNKMGDNVTGNYIVTKVYERLLTTNFSELKIPFRDYLYCAIEKEIASR